MSLIFMVIIWSFSFVLVDIAVEFIPPLSIALYRFIIASFSFLLIDIYKRIKKKNEKNSINEEIIINKFSRNEWILMILASFTGISLFFLAQYTSIQIIGPSLPALFVCLITPVIITILALIFFKEKLNLLKILGFIIATMGSFFLVTGGDISKLTPESPNFIGYLFALTTPILWAIYSTVTKVISKRISSNTMNKVIAYIGTIELFLFVLISGELAIFVQNIFNISLFLSAVYLGIGCYVIGYLIWQNSQKNLKSLKVASFLYIEPFLTLLFSLMLQRSESIVLWNIVGGIIVLVAVLIINYEKKN
ncbi:MAG: EamA family transporter [Promethearchaeota archaeon]|nr:MAG: EamA family transporter [Candidatus Lokiarchaeota archaeon]